MNNSPKLDVNPIISFLNISQIHNLQIVTSYTEIKKIGSKHRGLLCKCEHTADWLDHDTQV